MNPNGDTTLITDANGRIGTALMQRLREDFDDVLVDARRKSSPSWRPLWTGDAIESGPINATDAGGNRHVV
jgi:uncharacterized protein YbjT (DUF2867 family)